MGLGGSGAVGANRARFVWVKTTTCLNLFDLSFVFTSIVTREIVEGKRRIRGAFSIHAGLPGRDAPKRCSSQTNGTRSDFAIITTEFQHSFPKQDCHGLPRIATAVTPRGSPKMELS